MAQQDASQDAQRDILDIFKKFLSHHVAPFGHYLRVPYEQVQIITGRSNVLPQQQAFEIYDFWEKNRDSTLSDEEHQRTLQDALQHCGHGRAAENLVHSPGSRSNTITNGELDESTVYHKLLEIDDLNNDKIKRFGLKLGLTTDIIDNTMTRHNSPDVFKPVIALAVFAEWKRRCNKGNERMTVLLNEALTEIGSQPEDLTQRGKRTHTAPTITRSLPSVPIRPRSAPNGETQPLLRDRSSNIQDDTQPNPPNQDPLPNPDIKQPKLDKRYKIAGCVSCTFCIVTAAIIEVVLLVLALSYKQEEMFIIFPGDTILLPLPSYTPSSLDLLLFGQKSTCYAEVLVAKCSNIRRDETQVFNLSDIDYNYFAPDSSVTISGNNLIRPYQIWLFSNKVDADSAVKEQFHGYNCLSAADYGALCAQLMSGGDTATISVTESAYYYIRCDQEPFDCSQVDHWLINAVTYDFDVAHDYIIHSAKVQAQNTSSSKLRIRPSVFYLEYSASNLCPIAQLNTTICGSHDTIYRIDTSSNSLVLEIFIYATLVTVALLIVPLVACIIWCYRKKKEFG